MNYYLNLNFFIDLIIMFLNRRKLYFKIENQFFNCQKSPQIVNLLLSIFYICEEELKILLCEFQELKK